MAVPILRLISALYRRVCTFRHACQGVLECTAVEMRSTGCGWREARNPTLTTSSRLAPSNRAGRRPGCAARLSSRTSASPCSKLLCLRSSRGAPRVVAPPQRARGSREQESVINQCHGDRCLRSRTCVRWYVKLTVARSRANSASGNDGGCGPGALSGPARWQSGGNVPLTARGCRVEILLVCHSDTRSDGRSYWQELWIASWRRDAFARFPEFLGACSQGNLLGYRVAPWKVRDHSRCLRTRHSPLWRRRCAMRATGPRSSTGTGVRSKAPRICAESAGAW